MATKQCVSYTDFLGNSALNFKTKAKNPYTRYICVYALSAYRTPSIESTDIDNIAISDITAKPLSELDWQTMINMGYFKFVSANYAEFMCYKFKMSDITTESDSEPDVPYSYEEFFNDNVLNHMSASTAMQYKHIYEEYTNSTPQTLIGTTKTSKDLLINNFKTTNNLVSDTEFARSDYYKFFIPETDIVHDKSVLELNDGDLASVSNSAHASFNCLLYCINPDFDASIEAGTDGKLPKGFVNCPYIDAAIPISICTYTKDISLAGNNVQFEPNLNGIVTVE